MGARGRLILSLLGLVAVVVVGTAGYVVLTDASVRDAAYMTVITVSTVGFTEAIPLDVPGRIWTIVVIVFGIAGVSVAFSSLLSLFVGGELRAVLGRHKVQAKIDNLREHVILCGYGRMGAMAAKRLRQDGASVVVVEIRSDLQSDLEATGMLFELGDATEEDVLKAAGLMRASSLISTLPGDADNVFVALTARGLRPDLQIIARAELPSTEVKLRRAGANRVICPQVIGAKRIAAILTRPNVVDFFDVAAEGVELEMQEHRVAAGSPLEDATLRSAELRQQAGAMVVAIKRADGTSVFHPDPDLVIREGDLLILIGREGTSTRLEALGCAGR